MTTISIDKLILRVIRTIKQGCFAVVALSLSACSLIESTTTTNNQIQSLEKISSTPRDKVEADIVKYKSFFDSVGGGMPFNDSSPSGQFTTDQQYQEKLYSYDYPYYGQIFFSSMKKKNDLFLSIFLSSNHDYTEFERQSGHDRLFVPKLYICKNGYANSDIYLAIFPNDEPEVIDNQHHFVAQISIPILIYQGYISDVQEDLCIHTEFLDADFGLLGEHKEWVFNDITIESYKIEALMQTLNENGIIYEYAK